MNNYLNEKERSLLKILLEEIAKAPEEQLMFVLGYLSGVNSVEKEKR